MSPDRRTDDDSRDRIDEIQLEYQRLAFRLLLSQAFQILVLLATVGAILVLIGENSERVDQINTERAANVERNCEDVNRRHDNTIAALDQLIAQRLKDTPSKQQRAQIRQSRVSTVLLIEALTPKRNCDRFAAQQVTTP